MGCRKNLTSLTPAERTAFVNAFITLIDNGTTQKYANIHASAMLHGHGGPAFVAWHREFVLRFELDLQAVDPDVSLPYWDWTQPNLDPTGTQSLIWRDDFLGGPGDDSSGSAGRFGGFPVTSGPFAGKFTRKPFNIFSSPGSGGLIATHTINPDFNEFRRIEGPHGSAHVFCGGDVQGFDTTCLTPDFWLIHCNVDRLWAQWIKDHEGAPSFAPYKPVVGGPTGHSLNDSMWPWNGTSNPVAIHPWVNSPEIVTPADMIDHLVLGYNYDSVDGCGSAKPFKEFLPKERLPKEGLPKEFLPKERLPKEGLPKEFLPKERLPKEGLPKEFLPKERLPKEGLPKESSPKEFSPKESSPKEGFSKELGPKEVFEGGFKTPAEGNLFIDPGLRPDLSVADLALEPGVSDTDVSLIRDDLLSRRAALLRGR